MISVMTKAVDRDDSGDSVTGQVDSLGCRKVLPTAGAGVEAPKKTAFASYLRDDSQQEACGRLWMHHHIGAQSLHSVAVLNLAALQNTCCQPLTWVVPSSSFSCVWMRGRTSHHLWIAAAQHGRDPTVLAIFLRPWWREKTSVKPEIPAQQVTLSGDLSVIYDLLDGSTTEFYS